MALSDALWARYKLGDAFKVMDPATKAPAVRNPFLHSDGVAFANATIPTLVGRGVIFTVCNVGSTVISGKMAGNAGVTAEYCEAGMDRGAGAGHDAGSGGCDGGQSRQEHGCTYCYGG